MRWLLDGFSEFTDKGEFQYLTNLKGASKGDLPVYNTISFTKIKINILSENTSSLYGTTLLPLVSKS